ncbi:MAG: hypothetical protein GXP17_07890 [Gammaproteobacteria bacterium]|nr:hypothetical protein [Gammaproteobacteria bacterium]
MKTSVATAVIAAALIAAGSVTAANKDAGSIKFTKHNLGASGTGPNKTDGTNEICIFCHTPHGGDIGAAVPLWNKKLSTAIFKTYDQLGTSTLDAAVDYVGSVSLACLTCHDGTQAIDNIRNAPGSGQFLASGGDTDGLKTADGWSWNSSDSTLDAEGRFQNSVDDNGTNIWMLGTDLRNDHPISMQYAGGPAGNAVSLNAFRDIDFKPITAVPGVSNRWYVENTSAVADAMIGASTGFDKWDFKLYTRDTGAGTHPQHNPAQAGHNTSANGATFVGGPEPFVECGSCHDPHFQTTTFLRMQGHVNPGGDINVMSNRSSKVCLTCHSK